MKAKKETSASKLRKKANLNTKKEMLVAKKNKKFFDKIKELKKKTLTAKEKDLKMSAFQSLQSLCGKLKFKKAKKANRILSRTFKKIKEEISKI